MPEQGVTKSWPPRPPEPTEEQLAECGRRDALTPWKLHKKDVEAERTRRTACRQQVQQCQTWEERPLLCRLGIHSPHVRVSPTKNDYFRSRCLLCGFEWGGICEALPFGR